jgi:hypothetical protein
VYAEVQRYKTLNTSNLKLKTPYDEPDARINRMHSPTINIRQEAE